MSSVTGATVLQLRADLGSIIALVDHAEPASGPAALDAARKFYTGLSSSLQSLARTDYDAAFEQMYQAREEVLAGALFLDPGRDGLAHPGVLPTPTELRASADYFRDADASLSKIKDLPAQMATRSSQGPRLHIALAVTGALAALTAASLLFAPAQA
jgi:hypothetical protein